MHHGAVGYTGAGLLNPGAGGEGKNAAALDGGLELRLLANVALVPAALTVFNHPDNAARQQ